MVSIWEFAFSKKDPKRAAQKNEPDPAIGLKNSWIQRGTQIVFTRRKDGSSSKVHLFHVGVFRLIELEILFAHFDILFQ